MFNKYDILGFNHLEDMYHVISYSKTQNTKSRALDLANKGLSHCF